MLMILFFGGTPTGPESRASRARVVNVCRSLLSRLAASCLIGTTLASPVRAFDLHYRQNGTSFSARELRRIFSDALPASYDQ